MDLKLIAFHLSEHSIYDVLYLTLLLDIAATSSCFSSLLHDTNEDYPRSLDLAF